MQPQLNPELGPDGSLHVVILREPFIDYFVIVLDNGHTEELDPEECRQWFRERGANMDKIESALDQVWNFQRAEVILRHPKEPPKSNLPYSPDV